MAAKKANTNVKPMNVTMERRIELALHAGYEVHSLAALIQAQIPEMESAETCEQEVAVYTFLERLDVLSRILMDVGSPQEDGHHDDAAMSETLRIPCETAETDRLQIAA
jgi:hypothetical protein